MKLNKHKVCEAFYKYIVISVAICIFLILILLYKINNKADEILTLLNAPIEIILEE